MRGFPDAACMVEEPHEGGIIPPEKTWSFQLDEMGQGGPEYWEDAPYPQNNPGAPPSHERETR
ncbi:hypothetical protein BH23VER1_BH23VER1_07150 [soil metagenome]